jgi:hypothetical protein
LILIYVVFMMAVVTAKVSEARRWAHSLVAYELRFPRDLHAIDVTAWISQLAGLVAPRWQRPLAVRGVVVETSATRSGIRHYLLVPPAHRDVVLGALRATLPALRVIEVDQHPPPDPNFAAALGLSNWHRSLRVDQSAAASAAILASLQPLAPGEAVTLQWLVTPAGPQRPVTNGRQLVNRWQGGAVVQVREPEAMRAARVKQLLPIFGVAGRIGITASSPGRQRQLLQRVLAPFHAVSAPGVHLFRRRLPGSLVRVALSGRWMPLFHAPLRLNATELAVLVGWPVEGVALPGVRLGGGRQLAPSPDIPSRGLVIGHSTFPGAERPLALSWRAALRHLLIEGPTGVGKSTLLCRLILQCIEAGFSATVIDPKNNLVDDIKDRLVGRTEVVIVDPTDATRPVGLNVLGGSGPAELRADQIVAIMHALWRDNWGPRLDDILRCALLTLMSQPGLTLAEVPLLLTDANWRRRLVGRLDDVFLKGMWAQFDSWSDGERAQAIAPVMTRLRSFLLRRRIRNVVAQAEPRFSFETALALGQVVLMPLGKGVIGEEAASLFGALAISRLWQAAMGRVALRPEQRKPAFIFLDEAQDFLTLPTSVPDMLAQGRGLGVSVTLSHQHLAQLPPPVRAAVLANAGSRIVFQTAADDARVLARDLSPLTADDLQALGQFEVAARLATDAGIAPPVTAVTRPLGPSLGTGAAVREQSRRTFGVDALEVEAAMQRRHEPTPTGPVGRRRA